MKCASVYIIFLMIYLFSSTGQTCVLKLWQGTKYDMLRLFSRIWKISRIRKAWYKNHINSCINPEYGNFPGHGNFPGYGNNPGYGS